MDLSYNTYSKCDRCREGKMNEYENLCYYHDKMERGLIDEPEHEVAYVETMIEEPEMLDVFMEQLDYVAYAFCPEQWQDEAKNYAGMAYRRAVKTWDSEKASWKTFCYNVIKNRVIDYMRKEGLYQERNEFIPEDMIMEDSLNPEYLCILKGERDDLRDAISNVMMGMSDREHDVLWRRMIADEPVTLQDLADRYGTTESSIRRDEQRIITKIREEIEYDKI